MQISKTIFFKRGVIIEKVPVYDFIELLQDCDYFKQADAFRLHEMITYKAQFRKSNLLGKITSSLANLDIFWANLIFKRKTNTAYGFNR